MVVCGQGPAPEPPRFSWIAVGTAVGSRPPHRSVPERLTHTAPPSDQRSDVRDVVTCRVSHVAIKTCGIRLKVREIGGKLGPPTKWMTRNWGHPRSGSPPWLDAEPGPAIGRVQRELIPIVATNWVAVSSPPACQINDRIHRAVNRGIESTPFPKSLRLRGVARSPGKIKGDGGS